MASKTRVAAVAFSLCAILPARAVEPLTVLSGDPSGIYFPLGIAVGKILSNALPERTIQVQVSRGSVANLKQLADAKGEIAFALADSIEAAKRGDAAAGFDKPLAGLRGLGALYPSFIQIVASAKSGIRSLADLKGKRLSVGAPQSGTELNARRILAAAGLDDDEVAAVREIGFSESVTQMKEDKLDATLQSAGLGVASLNELSNTAEIVVIAIPKAVVEKLGPLFVPATIPANTYKGQNDAIASAAVMNYLVTRADLPADHVRRMTAAIFDRLDQLTEAHAATRGMTLATAAVAGPVPMHPGAMQYFRDKGLMKRGDADVLNARGEERRAKGEFAPALADFAEALRLDPDHQGARDNRRALARELERQGARMGMERAR